MIVTPVEALGLRGKKESSSLYSSWIPDLQFMSMKYSMISPPAVVCGYLLPSNRQLEHLECSFSRGTRKGRCKETQVGLNYFIVIFILLFPKYLLISYHSSSTIESAKDKTVGKDRHNYWAHKKYSLFWILGENRSRVQAEDLLGIYSL